MNSTKPRAVLRPTTDTSEFLRLCQALVSLNADPHPGLSAWNMACVVCVESMRFEMKNFATATATAAAPAAATPTSRAKVRMNQVEVLRLCQRLVDLHAEPQKQRALKSWRKDYKNCMSWLRAELNKV